MPRIISYTPAWLSRPCPGFELFNSAHATGRAANPKNSKQDVPSGERHAFPNRTIARRGAEVFVVAGSQIRWADLSQLKEGWEQLQETPSKEPKSLQNGQWKNSDENGPEDGSYKVWIQEAALRRIQP